MDLTQVKGNKVFPRKKSIKDLTSVKSFRLPVR